MPTYVIPHRPPRRLVRRACAAGWNLAADLLWHWPLLWLWLGGVLAALTGIAYFAGMAIWPPLAVFTLGQHVLGGVFLFRDGARLRPRRDPDRYVARTYLQAPKYF